MALAWVFGLLYFFTVTPGSFSQYHDFDAYDLYGDDFSVPSPYQLMQQPSRFRSSLMNVPMYRPQDLYPYNFPSQKNPINIPRVPNVKRPGRFRTGEGIIDEMNNDPSTFVVKKTSGKNPPPLPMGFDNLLGTSRAMQYESVPERRTLGLLAQGMMDLTGQSRLDDMELQNQRDRLEDLRFQASLDQLHSQHEMDDLRAEMRNRYDRDDGFASDREYDYKLSMDRLRNEHNLQQNLQQHRYEDDYYNDKITTTYNPKLTTKTKLTFGFPILG